MLRILVKQTKLYAEQHARQYARVYPFKPRAGRAGIRGQAKIDTNDDTEYESNDWDDDPSKYEGDLSNTSNVYKQFREESIMERDNLRRKLVRDKYFKKKQLSFLTWAEMEQIRLLNTNEPEEWNPEKLSESFPADVLTIRKVLKAKWLPRDEKRVAKRDETVRKNWKSFVNGDLKEMDPQFSEHLKRFSTRNLSVKVDYASVLKKELPKPESTEFVGIITSCKKYQDEPKQIASAGSLTTHKQPVHSAAKGSSAIQKIKSNKLYTFKASNSESNTPIGAEAEIIFDNPNGTGVKNDAIESNKQKPSANPFAVSKYENNEAQLQPNDLRSVDSIRDHIDIPKKLFKEGATYRFHDCYYDDDGEFLYRVPGITKV